MRDFMPSSPQGNIRYAYFDICEPPADDLKDAFDLSLVRLVLGGSGKVGIDAAVANIAGKVESRLIEDIRLTNIIIATVAPGGWMQIMEMDLDPDYPGIGAAMGDLIRLIGGIFYKTGFSARYCQTLDESFKKAGLKNVTLQQIGIPLGALLEKETPEIVKTSYEAFKISIPSLSGAAKCE